MFEKFDIESKDIFKVCVVATMSSGKSTFINSIIGEEVLPEKNEACTARTMSVLDNDAATVKKVHIIRKNGNKEVVEIDSRDVLTRINNDEDVVEFLVETNIQSIHNTSRALLLVDTPGVNNSEDERHGERTESFLKQMDMGVIIYLLNATQLATNDDSMLLQFVSNHVKKHEENIKIIFVINKIDALDLENESIVGTVKIAKDYIEQHGIKNPIIYPLSALAAKTLRMALYKREMTRRELRKLEDIYEHYQSKDNNMLAFAMSDELSEDIYQIGERQVSAQELQRAIDNTGITAVEKRISGFMYEMEQHYVPEIVIKSKVPENYTQELQKKLDRITSFPKNNKLTRFIDINEKIENNILIQSLNKDLPNYNEMTVTMDLTEGIESSSATLHSLIRNMEETKTRIFKVFDEDAYMGVKRANGIFLCPEKENDYRMSIKKFYLVSEDGIVWRTIQFGYLTKLIEDKITFYLYNEYSKFIFLVKPEYGMDIVALLDVKMPVRMIKIAGLDAERVEIDTVLQYIEKVEKDEEVRKNEIKEAEEQLKRTYKGIVFDNKELKEKAIKKERELQKYCLHLEERSHMELWKKKEEIKELPNVIFGGFVSKLISALDVRENKEKKVFLERIDLSELESLDVIVDELEKEHYSDNNKYLILEAIENRRIQCQRRILDLLMRDYDKCSRSELKNLCENVKKKNYNSNITDEYIEKIFKQNDLLEMQELEKICLEIEKCSITELEKCIQLIQSGDYQDKFTEQYYQRISARIEFLHIQNMEQYCKSIATVDRETLKKIQDSIKNEDCNPSLKIRFLELVEQRNEKLDYEELCSMTNNLKEKGLQELETLYNEIRTGKYNEKFVKPFIVKCRVSLEMAQYATVNVMLSNLSDMDKSQVSSIWHEIGKKGYSDRIRRTAKEKIDERIYQLDMYELIKLNNDFNNLSFKEIQDLRSVIRQKAVCDRAVHTYEKKLQERELVKAYQMIRPMSCLIKRTIEQYGLSSMNIFIATFTEEYLKLLNDHFDKTGKKEYEDIPIFFYPDCSNLAFSKTSLYYKTSSGYIKMKLSEIRSFGIEKKFFQEVLLITFTNGEGITLSGGLSKKNAQGFINILNDFHQSVAKDMRFDEYEPYSKHIPEFSTEQFGINETIGMMTEEMVIDMFISKLNEADVRKDIASIRFVGGRNWDNYCNKASTGMGIANDRLIFYYDRTILGTAKEGFAIGIRYLHIKSGQQPLVSLPLISIYNVEINNGKISVVTVDNNIYTMELVSTNERCKVKIVEMVDEYIKGIQLIHYLEEMNMKKTTYKSVSENTVDICPKCNANIHEKAKFCHKCGSKILSINDMDKDDKFFCTQCGNKIMRGARFCIGCGAKVGE